MSNLKIYRVFISHAWTYDDDYYRLEEMLNEAPNFIWHNYSVPKHDELDTVTNAELEEALRRQISPTNIVIILSGMYVAYREWIQKEINIAIDMFKPIMGVKPWGQEKVPEAVQDVVYEIVGWNTSSIIDAIKRYAL